MARATTKQAEEKSTEAEEAQAEASTEAEEIDLSAFEAALTEAIENSDESTGDVPEANLASVTEAYRGLEGLKAKNAARTSVDEKMKAAMSDMDLPLARSYLSIQKTGLKPANSGKSKAPKEPVDPTQNFVQLFSGLRLALNLVGTNVPEGVSEDWQDRADAEVSEHLDLAKSILEFRTNSEAEGEEPEADAWVVAAVNLALGKSAKVAGRRAKSGQSRTYDGPRRSVMAHIEEVTSGLAKGEFMSVSEIVNTKSDEYGNDKPSAGAVSSRLKSNSFSSDSLSPEVKEGKMGVVKN